MSKRAKRYKIGKSRGTKSRDTKSRGTKNTQEKKTQTKRTQTKSVSGSGSGISLIDFYSNTHQTDDLDQRGAMEAYGQSPPLQMAVSLIASSVASVEYQWEGGMEPSSFDLSMPAPSQDISKQDFYQIVTSHLLLCGESYILKREGLDSINLLPIPPHIVSDERADDRGIRIENARFEFEREAFSRDDFIVIREQSLLDPYAEGRRLPLAHDVDIDTEAARHTSNFLQNDAKPSMIATLSGASKEEMERWQKSMRKRHGGGRNAGKIQAFTDADINIQQIEQSFCDLGLTEIRKYSVEVIRRIWGIPPAITGLTENANRATVKTSEYIFKKHTIKPKVQKINTAINEQFVKPDLGEEFRLTFSEVIPENRQFQLQVMKEFPDSFDESEKRSIAGYDAREDNENPDQNLEE